MPIAFRCAACGFQARVPDSYAGKRGKCPQCKGVVQIPAAAQSAAPAPAAAAAAPSSTESPAAPAAPATPTVRASAESPAAPTARTSTESPAPPTARSSTESPAASSSAESAARWLLKIPEGEVFGPVARSELNQWVEEGRVSADCLVSTAGSETWRAAVELFPELAEEASPFDFPIDDPRGRSTHQPPDSSGLANEPADESPADAATPATPTAPASSSTSTRSRRTRGARRGRKSAGAGQAHEGDAAPHRATLLLVLGIVSLLAGCGLGLLAAVPTWLLARRDLAAMDQGRMDAEGRSMTRVGMILALVALVVNVLGLVLLVVLMSIGGLAMLTAGG